MKPLLIVIVTLSLGACSGKESNVPTAPSAPPAVSVPQPPTALPAASMPNWKGDATVIAVEGHGAHACGWGTSIGESRTGVEWRVLRASDGSVSLDEDMRNWPTDDITFTGTLSAYRFTASYNQGVDYLKWSCQFREATLVGTFNDDFTTFDATETLAWGAPGADTVVTRHWVARQL